MNFSEKLDLLMNITNTTNSALGRSISLDNSYISRLRRGVRTPARNENYLKTMAHYFSKHCSSDYQTDAICSLLKIHSKDFIEDDKKLSSLIYKWFIMDEEIDSKESIESFIEDVTQFKFKRTKPASSEDELNIPQGLLTSDDVFYGVEGKRTAVINFLFHILKSNTPQTLLLFSDEDLEWLTGNRDFAYKWASLLSKVIIKGNSIKIIHTVNRNLDEMLSAINEWLPIYMTGLIEPFYYPKARDGVFKRTLFIAPDTVALSSSSIGSSTANTANFLYFNKGTINALIEEYNSYLSLCRPLMKIFTSASKNIYLSTLKDFEDEDGDSIIKSSILSSITMPIDIAESILSSMDASDRKKLLSYQEMRLSSLENHLQKYRHTEIITLPDVESIKMGKIKVGFSDMLSNKELFYNSREFRGHLEHIIKLLKTFDNYNIYFDNDSKNSDYLLYTKEDVGIIVAKTSFPVVAFAINESNMTSAFWNYLDSITYNLSNNKSKRKATIHALEKIVEELSLI